MGQTSEPAPSAVPGGEVVRGILLVAEAMRRHMEADLARLGLTPALARALEQLDPDRPLPARELAGRLDRDPSNITLLADRLEQAGLVRRQPDPADRRLRTLAVTDTGRRVRERVIRIGADARMLAGLTGPELSTLRDLLAKLAGTGCPTDDPTA